MDKSWLTTINNKIQSLFIKTQSINEDNDNLLELPQFLKIDIKEYIESLDCPVAYQESVQEAIAPILKKWLEDPEAENSIVILGNPVENLSKIIDNSIENWKGDRTSLEIITPLPFPKRPRNPLTISEQIKQSFELHPQVEIDNLDEIDNIPDEESLEERTTIIVIPTLEALFLRDIEGWNSIIFLRELIIHNPNCFWIVGCNHLAWDFLDYVCQIKAYFNTIHSLPNLEGAMLRDWLDPLIKTVVDNKFKKNQQLTNDNSEEEDHDESYWNYLADESSGVASIALNLWINSLRLDKENVDEEKLSQITFEEIIDTESSYTLQQITPYLPDLPFFSINERYLLHSVLIHGHINRSHLALSLAEPESHIEAQIQRLLRESILKREKGTLSISPIYYQKLKKELINNNFFVGSD
ncbi:MAG: MarR family transcriptional regulator [Cyanobacterium sp.]